VPISNRKTEGKNGTFLFAAVITMIDYNSTVIMKLWYWVVSTKLNILKEIKQLQLEIVELARKEEPLKN
jgi:hypothetical protein